MKYRQLGSSDLEVSEISLGSWLTFSGGVGLEQVRACTDAAFEAGINFFDTANVYGRGAAETAWGQILSGRPRGSYVLATKVWGQMSDDPADRGLSAAQIGKQIDASLTRLRTDYVDLYQAHRFDPDVPVEETVEALQQVVTDGKARCLGFSEWTPEQIQAAIDIAGPGSSCPPSRSTPCSGGPPRRRSSPSPRPTASRRSSGHPWPRGCSPASTAPGRSRRPVPARPAPT